VGQPGAAHGRLRLGLGVRLAGPERWGHPPHPVEMLSQVRAPVLVVHGEDDAYFPLSDAEELAAAAGGAATLWREPAGFGHAEDGLLDHLADAELVVTGRRKHPGGGRPAKVYVAREQAAGGQEVQVPPGSQLAVHTVVQLIAGLAEHLDKLAILAEHQGRKLVAAAAGRADTRDFEAAAVVAVEALRAAFPEVRLGEVDGDTAVVEGLETELKLVGEVDGDVGDALATGFLRGALAAAGAPAEVTARGGVVRRCASTRAASAPSRAPSPPIDARARATTAG
jgi:hypothetical protein